MFPYSSGQSAQEAAAAGLELRRACLKVSAQGSNQKPERYMPSGGNSEKRRFLRQFDRPNSFASLQVTKQVGQHLAPCFR